MEGWNTIDLQRAYALAISLSANELTSTRFKQNILTLHASMHATSQDGRRTSRFKAQQGCTNLSVASIDLRYNIHEIDTEL